MKILENTIAAMKENYICDNCLGRTCASLLSGYSNEQRGKILRQFIAFLIDSGEKIDVDLSNFYGIKFRNVKIKPEKPTECKICKNFFLKKIDEVTKNIIKKLDGAEFKTFLIGSVPSNESAKMEEEMWNKIGIEFCEPMKSEINRELGKRIEKLTRKEFDSKNPDVTAVIDLNTDKIRTDIRSLYVFGKYKKLVRGIPQAKWICLNCNGKGCTHCKGEGKLYPTSVQEIIEKPLLKATKSRKSKLSASGREDIDARCLDWRPFVIELIKPIKRKINLKKIEKEINKSKKVNVNGLKFATKDLILGIKTSRIDKTYLAIVDFKNLIDKKKLKKLKKLKMQSILQKTPLRVVHRRADKFRKRIVKSISWKLLNKKRMQFKIRAEAGLYIKELISGDEGRTKPNISELLDNKVKRISLDVIKIHTK
jgi:tRNA pseudouridine synthase 10